jgi:arylsulfatase A-like enzyme
MTGRSPDRAGVLTHGYALRLQEKTIAQALNSAGYVTGHFGKWHLNGFKGAGAPILSEDPRNPGVFGFERWTSVTNFFDVGPLMSRNGEIHEFTGDSSDVVVAEACSFLEQNHKLSKPMFAVVWFGTPHSPFKSLPEDRAAFGDLNEASANHYGELVAMDRSIGTLRRQLRDLKIAENTLLVFCSDNGGLPEIKPDTVGGLRGFKASVFEGGLRVPGIMEWPAVIQPRITSYPACTMDLFPTIADLLGLPEDVFVQPLDGLSLKTLLTEDSSHRTKPIPFRFGAKTALIDNQYKLLSQNHESASFELYDLENDPGETRNLAQELPDVFARMHAEWTAWNESVDKSFRGVDYPEGKVTPPDLPSIFWYDSPMYQSWLPQWKDRWEFKSYMDRHKPATKKKKAGQTTEQKGKRKTSAD